MVPGRVYHIYNHANGNENLFIEERNYFFFLDKLQQYVSPVAGLCAYCLMPNHFHLLVKLKEYEELLESSETFQKFEHLPVLKAEQLQQTAEKKISKSFSNLFSSYSQSFNKVYHRRGSLFMQNFKEEIVEDNISFCKVVHYIHANPVHHGFVKNMQDWKFSSYSSFLSDRSTKLDKEYVLDIFGGMKAFIEYHKQPVDLKIKFLDE